MKILLFISIILFSFKPLNIHQDTILKIDKNGKVIGLPKQYGPAFFDLKKYKLRVGNNQIMFPECIKKYFEIHEKPKLTLSASWYHSKEILPYFLNFNISEKGKNYSYGILINLETLELIEVGINVSKKNTHYFDEIKLDDYCLEQYSKNIAIVK